MADDFIAAGFFGGFGNFFADGDDPFPFGGQLVVMISFVDLGHIQQLNADGVAFLFQIGPDLFGGEGEDRRHQADKSVEDLMEHRLGGFAAFVVLGGDIETVFDDIQIEGAHIHNAEMVNIVEYGMEFVIFIAG